MSPKTYTCYWLSGSPDVVSSAQRFTHFHIKNTPFKYFILLDQLKKNILVFILRTDDNQTSAQKTSLHLYLFSTSYLNRTLHSLRRQIHFVCCNTKNWQVRADESPFLLNEDEWMHHLPPAGDSTCMQLQPFEPESAQSCTTSLWVSHDFIIWTPDTLWIHAMWRGDEFILIYLSTNGAQSPERNTEEASSEWTRADRWIRFCGH